MFALPPTVYNARRNVTYYVSDARVFRAAGTMLVDGITWYNTTVSSHPFLEISQDLIPPGTDMQAARAIFVAYLLSQDITQSDIDLFKLCYPDWAPNTFYQCNQVMNYEMTLYAAVDDVVSEDGDYPPLFPAAYYLPFAPQEP